MLPALARSLSLASAEPVSLASAEPVAVFEAPELPAPGLAGPGLAPDDSDVSGVDEVAPVVPAPVEPGVAVPFPPAGTVPG